MKNVLLIAFLVLGFSLKVFSQVPPPPPPPVVEEEVYMIVEQSPRFPGCEHLDSKEEKEACATKKLLEYIYSNLKYPEDARSSGVEGQAIVQFVVGKTGKIEDINLVRDLEGGCGQAALKIVQSMNDMPKRWTPGKQRGRAVRVKYTLPLKFKLTDDGEKTDDGEETNEEKSPEEIAADLKLKREQAIKDSVYLKPDVQARFPGCEDKDLNETELRMCSERAMLSYIYGQLKYPAEARKKGIEGMVVIQYTVDKDGTLDDIRIARDLGSGCGEESLRVVRSMNAMPERWVPGMKDGEVVKVLYNMPIKFKLENGKGKRKRKRKN